MNTTHKNLVNVPWALLLRPGIPDQTDHLTTEPNFGLCVNCTLTLRLRSTPPYARRKDQEWQGEARILQLGVVDPILPTYHPQIRIGAREAEGAGLLIRCTG